MVFGRNHRARTPLPRLRLLYPLSSCSSSKKNSSAMSSCLSQVCQNYNQDCEAAVNRQINLELYASYVCLSMSFHFDWDDVSLKNFAKYFLHQSHKEREAC
ncbi:unnamed protein product [Caretta caretta]